MAKKNKTKTCQKLSISSGLEGLDDCWEVLVPLFEQLQLVSVDLADPTLDLLTFAHSAHYFGVLRLVTEVVEDKGKGQDDDEDDNVAFTISQRNTATSSNAKEINLWQVDAVLEESGELAYEPPTETAKEPLLYSQLGSDWTGGQSNTNDTDPPEIRRKRNTGIIGFAYLIGSQDMHDPMRTGELRIGVIIDDAHRKTGYAREAVLQTLEIAFKDPQCNRVQAVLVDSPYKDRALTLFMKSGLGHEGIRRRGFRSPYDLEFKDVTYLGLLATDWFMRNVPGRSWISAPKSLWDELFARHQREREELLQWEAKQLKRSHSTETVRQAYASGAAAAADDDDDDMYDAESSSDAESVYSDAYAVSKRRRTESSSGAPPLYSANHSVASSAELLDEPLFDLQKSVDNPETSSTGGINWLAESTTHVVHRGESPAFSDDSDIDCDFSDGYATSTSSQWDVVEVGSSSGLSEADYEALHIDDV